MYKTVQEYLYDLYYKLTGESPMILKSKQELLDGINSAVDNLASSKWKKMTIGEEVSSDLSEGFVQLLDSTLINKFKQNVGVKYKLSGESIWRYGIVSADVTGEEAPFALVLEGSGLGSSQTLTNLEITNDVKAVIFTFSGNYNSDAYSGSDFLLDYNGQIYASPYPCLYLASVKVSVETLNQITDTLQVYNTGVSQDILSAPITINGPAGSSFPDDSAGTINKDYCQIMALDRVQLKFSTAGSGTNENMSIMLLFIADDYQDMS